MRVDAERESRIGVSHLLTTWAGSSPIITGTEAKVTGLHLTSGGNRDLPITTEAARGLKLLEDTLGPGALAPHQFFVDTGRPGGAFAPEVVAAQRRLIAELRRDREVQPSTIQPRR